MQRNNEFSPIKNANKIEIEKEEEDDQEMKLTTTNIQNKNHQNENHQKDQKNEMIIENEEEEKENKKIWSMEEVNELFLKHSKSSNQPPPNDLIGRDTPLSARWFISHTYIYIFTI